MFMIVSSSLCPVVICPYLCSSEVREAQADVEVDEVELPQLRPRDHLGGLREYCSRVLFRHPSTRRVA